MPISEEESPWRWEGMGHILPQIPSINTYITDSSSQCVHSHHFQSPPPACLCLRGVISSSGGDLCSVCKSKQVDHDRRSLRFYLNLPTFGNIWLSSFKYLPEDVEHRWTCSRYMTEPEVASLGLDQAPDEALLQTSSLKHDAISC